MNTEQKAAPANKVYVAGRHNGQAALWINGNLTYLTNGGQMQAREVTVENNNIYVWGSGGTAPNIGEYYWKNNVRHNIRQSLNIASGMHFTLHQFYVKNGDIYITGVTENPSPATPNERYELCYWKNGVKTVMHTSYNTEMKANILVKNGNLFVFYVKQGFNLTTLNDFLLTGYFNNGVNIVLTDMPNLVTFPVIFPISYFESSNAAYLLVWDGNVYKYLNLDSGAYQNSIGNAGKIIIENNKTYFIDGTRYYVNSSAGLVDFSADPDHLYYIDDMDVRSNSVYMIRASDDTGIPVSQKVFKDNIPLLSISEPIGRFNDVFVSHN